MNDNTEPDKDERVTPFENSYQLWMMVAGWAVLPSVIPVATFAGRNGWWFCFYVVVLLVVSSVSEKFKHLFKTAKWFRFLIYVNFSTQGALLLLGQASSSKDVLEFCPAISAVLLFCNYFNIDAYIAINRIDDVNGKG
ncbi:MULTISPECIES: hypothetical protein [unclassified Pseudomonas]|uniref:hypothetical protein n=1 Tax=unclassified Pseudomonas TaxID=196821 RepID=UPI0011B4967F|nr:MULTISPECIES: hypothetical protein [unclassified Pseudomonas]